LGAHLGGAFNCCDEKKRNRSTEGKITSNVDESQSEDSEEMNQDVKGASSSFNSAPNSNEETSLFTKFRLGYTESKYDDLASSTSLVVINNYFNWNTIVMRDATLSSLYYGASPLQDDGLYACNSPRELQRIRENYLKGWLY